jgi:hypothetical protein
MAFRPLPPEQMTGVASEPVWPAMATRGFPVEKEAKFVALKFALVYSGSREAVSRQKTGSS